MAGGATIFGGQGQDTINFAFTVTGTNTTYYAKLFTNQITNLIDTQTGGNTPITMVQSNTAFAPGAGTAVYDLVPSTVVGGLNTYSIGGPGYVIDTVSGNAALSLGASGFDTVIVAAVNSATAVTVEGGNNAIVFVTGRNSYTADTAAGSAAGNNDTIVAGSGFDTISTGLGSATVNSGTGDATIYLNDTTAGSSINQKVWLNDGNSVVYANGMNDAVVATTEGQTIYGGTSAGAYLTVALEPNSDGTANGNDLFNNGAGNALVYDGSSNNTINGGSGGLFVVTADNVTATITAGSGQSAVFAQSGDSIAFADQGGVTGGVAAFIAGAGSETVNGASAVSNILLYGSTTDTAASDSLVGGAGNDTFVAGLGNETLVGGGGSNLFEYVDNQGGGTINLADFGSNSLNDFALAGFGSDPTNLAADLTALQNGTEVNGNYVVTLADNTTIIFGGVTGASELQGHIINFG